ncbi:MAG TPA: HAMP domain-containing sensor histidine kinase [Candidatus Omnitrophota bacterium]|jgi:signal transduction histidine kinase|nr:HAMP domain-containing sensor histidine kinase [Candidatus Omnitrophota bacterium]
MSYESDLASVSKPGTPSEALVLHDFILRYRAELIERTRAKVKLRTEPPASPHELVNGIPMFLTQLGLILEEEASKFAVDGLEMRLSATIHGGELLKEGLPIANVVHDYGDLCQAITELALELHLPIATEDFHTLNRCLDNAIASAVAEYSRQHDVDVSGVEARRQGFLIHELRGHLHTALLAFQVVKSGKVGLTGSTIGVLERSLDALSHLIDQSVSEVRLSAGIYRMERIEMAELSAGFQASASVDAAGRGIQFFVEHQDPTLAVDADRQLLLSAIGNLLHNAFKFTRSSSRVWLRTRPSAGSALIEVEDECGGLPPGGAEALFRPFEQRGADRAGLGLGLAISRQAIARHGGTITVRDMPGRGCVFVVEIPQSFGSRADN